MKLCLNISLLLLLTLLISSCTESCTRKQKEGLQKQKLTASDSYSFYIPSFDAEPEGILVILDPHAKSESIMDSLLQFAYEKKLYLLGLKEIKNGVPNYMNIIQRDINHFIQYKKLDAQKIYLLGFSGGARMAAIYGGRNRIDGLIMCGAGLGRQSQLPFPTALVSGMGDFNFMEQYYDPYDPKIFQRNFMAFYFNGKHHWPPVEILEEAIHFIVDRGKNTSDERAVKRENDSRKSYENKDYFMSLKNMELAYKLSSYDRLEGREKELKSLIKNPNIKHYFHRMNLHIEEELIRYKTLSSSLNSQDSIWWKNQLDYINQRASNKSNSMAANSYTRTKAYMGILMYSKLNAAFSGQEGYSYIPKYLSIYERLEPNNPDLYFFKGIYTYSQGNENDALKYLNKAIALGFEDFQKLGNYLPKNLVQQLQLPTN